MGERTFSGSTPRRPQYLRFRPVYQSGLWSLPAVTRTLNVGGILEAQPKQDLMLTVSATTSSCGMWHHHRHLVTQAVRAIPTAVHLSLFLWLYILPVF
jgi:hypothetical protein